MNGRKQSDDKLGHETKGKPHFENSKMVQDRAQTLMDAAFAQAQEKGDFDDLPHKGKKLDLSSGDALSNVLKNANYVPGWVDLQQRIRDEIREVVHTLDQQDENHINHIDSRIEEINELIAKYNREVPNPLLQKSKIYRDRIQQQLQKWE
ncbi:DnaJ family domain-containing protein [Caldalkalibacillus salinus]|uniref:DnaJ family domain-containing protein n=1 Tax=Caldalkalibacillus salinus TaxID=2803787 RepID=UPI00192483F3|nr:DnaJ family domain-containing protein [Caldalkalibacillus salinus]